VSFLIDAPWLYANGRVLARVPERAHKPVAAATIATFWGAGAAMYVDKPWIRWLWRRIPARDGRDFMINSGVLKFDHERDRRKADAISAAVFATYPLWLWLGLRHGRRR
jgi:hypothetical protein